MSEHKWQFGDWADIQGGRYRFLCESGELGFFLGQQRSTRYWKVEDAEYLTDCTGWDWQPPKPIEPPKGYRLVNDGVVHGGDMCLIAGSCGWRESERVGDCIEYLLKNGFAKAYARKIESQYRPFANAAEFAPHRDRWMKFKDGVNGRSRVVGYNDDGVWGKSLCDYESAFSEYVFEDGTPFGVEA